ncbi:MAG: DUF1015 domain-containing protein [Candidatus Omnitrophica bacterium]|nr:DUF1015 domain-containing protein [Candidatus Omnitrophota bacterium]
MTKIKPFKAITYNQEKIKDVSSVTCPPYDIISPQKQQYYHDINPYNFIHILLGKDIPGEDKYRRAANCFNDWRKHEILIQDTKPAIYFYSQEYKIRGEKRTRLGFVSLLHLEQKGVSIFGHEHTHLEPKEDRLKLLKELKANLSPIFVIFLDKKRIIQRLYQQVSKDNPFLNVTDDNSTVHKLWKLDAPEVLEKIQEDMAGENIFIADGHHRYEVACAYRDQMKEKLGTITGEESFNYVLAYFTNTDQRGLLIQPVHRLLKLKEELDLENFKAGLKNYFDVEEVKEKNRFFFLMEKGGRGEHVLGMYKNKKFWLLRLKNIMILDRIITDKPKEYKSLDVSILNHIILKKVLGYDMDYLENKENLAFNPSADEFIKRVDNDSRFVAFFLNPVKMEQIISVSLIGERMPPKSTYFYPKVLSGLVVNKFNEENR